MKWYSVRNNKHYVCSLVNSEVVPVHTMKAYSRSKGIVPLILNLGTRWKWVLTSCLGCLHLGIVPVPLNSSQDSLLNIATRYRLDGWGIKSLWGWYFLYHPDRSPGPRSLLYRGYQVFPGGKGPEHSADQLYLSIARFQMGRSNASASPLCLHRHIMGWRLLLPINRKLGGPRAYLDVSERWKISCSLWDSAPWPSGLVPIPIAQSSSCCSLLS